MNVLGPHPSSEELVAAVTGDPEVRSRIAAHLSACEACTRETARLAGVLEAAADELGPGRVGCPGPDELAELPPGSEQDHPHVRGCPLCRADLELGRELARRRLLGEAWQLGAPMRPEHVMARESHMVQAAPGARVEVDVAPGATSSGTMAGAAVALRVTGSEVIVELSGAPESPLELVLESDLLERRVALEPPGVELPKARWRRASVRPRRSG